MESNSSNNSLEIKQEFIEMAPVNKEVFVDIKPEFEDLTPGSTQNNCLKVITHFFKEQNDVVKDFETASTNENKDLSIPEIVTVKEEINDYEANLRGLRSKTKRKSSEILIKNEDISRNDDFKSKTYKCKSKSPKKNIQKATFSDSDNDFFDNNEPKKRKYRPRRKPTFTNEEKAEKERQKLERRTCQVCNAIFALPDGLRNHIRSKHTFEKPYSCKFCGERFSTRSSHSLHRRRHHGFQPFLCNLCGKTFLQKAHMEIHMRIHIPSKDKIRDVKCNFCSNVYTSKLNLKKHLLTKHTDPSQWQHECNVCGKKCFSTTDLTHHMRRHNDERKYKCVICGRGFFTKQTMNVHFRTHSANTAFNCEHCSKGYRSNEALQHHMHKVHGIGEVKTVSAPKHFCPICHEGFRQRARLEKHLVIHETGEEEFPFKCEKCNKQYKARNYFTIHMLDKHKEFLDDSYFKTHFKINTRESYTTFNESDDIELENN